MAESKRPGTMLYFADYAILKDLEPLQRLAIIDAFMAYAENGTMPQFDDQILSMIWKVGKFEHTADLDAERYMKQVNKAVNAANARWHKDEPQKVDMNALSGLADKV